MDLNSNRHRLVGQRTLARRSLKYLASHQTVGNISRADGLSEQRQGIDQQHARFAATKETAPERRVKLVHDIAGMCKYRSAEKIVNLLPEAKDTAPLLDLSGVPHGKGKEVLMYDPMADGVLPCIPGMELVNTSGKVDTIGRVKPDAVLMIRGYFETKVRSLKNPARPDETTYNYMSYADIVWEFKPTAAQDPFDDKVDKAIADPKAKQSLEIDTQQAVLTRGQLADYATQVMSLQHRTHVFTICIAGNKARIIRWDCSGVMASEAFDYQSPRNNYLGEFLWRYSHASRSERGFDDTAVEASPKEVQLFTTSARRYLRTFVTHDKDYREKLVNNIIDPEHVAYKIIVKTKIKVKEEVKVEDSIEVVEKVVEKTSNYIVRQPFAQVLSPCGRSTRGYLAYHVEGKKAVFFKDTWRTVTEGIPEEAEVYAILHEAGVPNLPTVLASGDVYNLGDGKLQETLTHVKNDDEDLRYVTIWLRHHIHHRIVQELALPISFVRNSRQLVQAIRNVLETIMQAFKTKGFLHRDISSGNVMLTQEFEGILNDWDHGIQDPQQHETRPYRTGTWAFMSIELLLPKPKHHTLIDDTESCFWLLLFIASRYFDGGVEPGCDLWDEMKMIRGVAKGGREKLSFLTEWEYEQVTWDRSPPLTRVIRQVAEQLQKYHVQRMASRAFKPDPLAHVAVMIQIFDAALASDDWPSDDDAVPDRQIVLTEADQQQEDLENTRARFTETTPTGDLPHAGQPLLQPQNASRTYGSMPPPAVGIRQAFPRATLQSATRDIASAYSTGDKRPGPVDDEALPGPSGALQNKRAKKDTEAGPDALAPSCTTADQPNQSPLTQSTSSGDPRPVAPLPRRRTRSASREDHGQIAEVAPAAPLRRSTRARSQNATRSAEPAKEQVARRVTRSSSRNANQDSLRGGPRTRARTRSANGRV